MIVAGSVADARRERHRRRGAGRPTPAVPVACGTLDDLIVDYFRARAAVLAPSTVRMREDDVRHRIHAPLGPVVLTALTRETIERWLSDLIRHAPSRRMVVQTLATLRVILAAGCEWGRIATNPAEGIRVPPRQTQHELPQERVLTEDHVGVLLALGATGLRQETMLRAAAEGGLRRGEVIGLRWSDVDLVERRIEVRRSVYQDRGAASTTGGRAHKLVIPTKGRRTRRVAISHAFTARLRAWQEEAFDNRVPDRGAYVWPGTNGEPMGEHTPTHVLRRALIRTGLTDEAGRPLVSFHGLRHTAASIMLARGVPIIVVSRQLGHANPQITATTYAHLLSDAQLDLAAEAFEGLGGADGMTVGMSLRR